MTEIIKSNPKSILNKASGFIAAYDFTLNPYRGCAYGCSCGLCYNGNSSRIRQKYNFRESSINGNKNGTCDSKSRSS